MIGPAINQGGVQPSGTINITENGPFDVTQYATANVRVGDLAFVKIETFSPSAVTNSRTFAVNGMSKNFIFLLICDDWATLQPQSSYALFCCLGYGMTIGNSYVIGTNATTIAMLGTNGGIGTGRPTITRFTQQGNICLTWSDPYQYLYPGLTYSAYYLNLGD